MKVFGCSPPNSHWLKRCVFRTVKSSNDPSEDIFGAEDTLKTSMFESSNTKMPGETFLVS